MDALVAAAAVHGADSPPADLVLEAAGHHALVAPELSRRLSKHQVVGVQWLYGAFHGAHNPGWRGCLLADGMGMGKTLQALTLLHTLLSSVARPPPPSSWCRARWCRTGSARWITSPQASQ